MATQEEILAEINRRNSTQLTASDIQQEIDRREREENIGFLENAGSQIVGGVEGALSMGTGIAGTIAGGLLGLAESANPFSPEGSGAEISKMVQDALTYNPRTIQGRQAIEGLAKNPVISTFAEKMQALREHLGDETFEATDSAVLAALAFALPDAILEIAGAGAGRRIATKTGRSNIVTEAQEQALKKLTQAENATGIQQLTSDIFPPESRIGKFFQARGEELNPAQRLTQQTERVRAVDRFLTNFDVDEAARFESKIYEGVKESIKKQKQVSKEAYDLSANKLDKMGNVNIGKTQRFASEIAEQQRRLGSLQRVDTGILAEVEPFLEVPETLTFNDIKNIRTAIGQKLRKAKQGAPVTGSGDVGLLSQIYKNLTDDMSDFAMSADKKLFTEWRKADSEFQKFAIGSDKTGVKSLIKKGESTPELVDSLLFSKKPSDLNFLAKNLDKASKKAASQRIVQRVLEKATKGGQAVKPNIFQSELGNLRKQIDLFFTPTDKKALDSLTDVLEKTRRAEDAKVATPTGQTIAPLMPILDPRTLAPGMVQVILERPSTRNLLIKRAAAKTAKQRNAIDMQLRAEINRLGLSTAALTGATTSQIGE